MQYKHNFNEVCSQVPFTILFDHLNIAYEREGKTLKTEDTVVTEGKTIIEDYTFDCFFYKATKKGGSVLDFAKEHLNLKSKIKACEWLKTNLLGDNEQKNVIPELKLVHDPFLQDLEMDKFFCNHQEFGAVEGRSVMSGRIAFKLLAKDNTHRGYIGYDHKDKKKVKWYIPKGTKTSDILYNLNRCNGTDYCILTQNPLEAVMLCWLGFTFTLGMVTQGLTIEQIELLKPFKRILLIHPKPENIVSKLSSQSFVKAIRLDTVKNLKNEDIKALF